MSSKKFCASYSANSFHSYPKLLMVCALSFPTLSCCAFDRCGDIFASYFTKNSGYRSTTSCWRSSGRNLGTPSMMGYFLPHLLQLTNPSLISTLLQAKQSGSLDRPASTYAHRSWHRLPVIDPRGWRWDV